MNFSHYFIKRPIFAGVLSIGIFVMGLLALFKLPISEYPEVVPPTVVVRAHTPVPPPRPLQKLSRRRSNNPSTGLKVRSTCSHRQPATV